MNWQDDWHFSDVFRFFSVLFSHDPLSYYIVYGED